MYLFYYTACKGTRENTQVQLAPCESLDTFNRLIKTLKRTAPKEWKYKRMRVPHTLMTDIQQAELAIWVWDGKRLSLRGHPAALAHIPPHLKRKR